MWTGCSAERDFAVDRVGQPNRLDGQYDLGLERLAAGDPLGGERVAHRLLDLALTGDADDLKEFADFHVEAVFVHPRLLRLTGCGWRGVRLDREPTGLVRCPANDQGRRAIPLAVDLDEIESVSVAGPLQRYRALLNQGKVRQDAAQARVVERLDALHLAL